MNEVPLYLTGFCLQVETVDTAKVASALNKAPLPLAESLGDLQDIDCRLTRF